MVKVSKIFLIIDFIYYRAPLDLKRILHLCRHHDLFGGFLKSISRILHEKVPTIFLPFTLKKCGGIRNPKLWDNITINCKLQVYATKKSRFFSDFDHIFLRNLHILQGLRGFFLLFIKEKQIRKN